MYFISLTLVLVFSALPGYLILSLLAFLFPRAKFDRLLLLPLAFAFSFILLAMIQLLASALGADIPCLGTVFYTLLVGALALYIRSRRVPLLDVPWSQVGAGGAYCAYLLVLLHWVPSYASGYSADWQLYYPNVHFYHGAAPLEYFRSGLPLEYLVKRTPFFSLYGSFFLNLFGRTFDFFQVVAIAANSQVLWAVAVIAVKLLRVKEPLPLVLIVALSPALGRLLLVPEPKAIGAFFLLLAFYFYLQVRLQARPEPLWAWLTGLLAVASVMCHPSMLLYAAFIYVDQVYLKVRRHRQLARQLWASSVTFSLLLVLPWVLFFGLTLGWRAVATPTLTISDPMQMSVWRYVWSRLTMALTTLFVSEPLLRTIGEAPLMSEFTWVGIVQHTRLWGNQILRFYEQTFLAGAGLASAVVLLACGLTRRRVRHLWQSCGPMLVWLSAGAGVCFLTHIAMIDNKGHATNLTGPLFLLVIAYVGYLLTQTPRWSRVVALAVLALEFGLTRFITFVVTFNADAAKLIMVSNPSPWIKQGRFLPSIMVAGIFLAVLVGLTRTLAIGDDSEGDAAGRSRRTTN